MPFISPYRADGDKIVNVLVLIVFLDYVRDKTQIVFNERVPRVYVPACQRSRYSRSSSLLKGFGKESAGDRRSISKKRFHQKHKRTFKHFITPDKLIPTLNVLILYSLTLISRLSVLHYFFCYNTDTSKVGGTA